MSESASRSAADVRGVTVTEARPVGAERLMLGEGPRWIGDHLVCVDILAGTLYRYDRGADAALAEPAGSASADAQLLSLLTVPFPLGAVAPRSTGGYIAAVGTGVALLDPGPQNTLDLRWIEQLEADAATPMRMNDGVADPFGNFWLGSMAYDNTQGAGSLYRVRPSGVVERVLGDLTIPNGPAFTPDGKTMYLADSALGEVYRFSVSPDGTLGARELFLDRSRALGPEGAASSADPGSPDGMTVDSAGHVWIAFWGAGEVRRYAADGQLLERVRVAATHVTAPCLGGPEGTTLFVTSAALDAPTHDAAPGSLFVAEVSARGIPAHEFRDEIPGG